LGASVDARNAVGAVGARRAHRELRADAAIVTIAIAGLGASVVARLRIGLNDHHQEEVGEEEEAALHGQVLFFDGGHFFIARDLREISIPKILATSHMLLPNLEFSHSISMFSRSE
jgi:hypothetical protein